MSPENGKQKPQWRLISRCRVKVLEGKRRDVVQLEALIGSTYLHMVEEVI